MNTENKRFFKELCKLMLPIAFQSFMLALVGASDSLMLGMVSEEQLAAVSLACKVQFVENIFIAGIVGTGMVLASQYLGKEDKYTTGKIYSLMIKYSVVVSIIFFLLSYLIPKPIIQIFTNDSNMIEIGASYLKITSISYFVVGITQSFLMILKTDNRATSSAMISFSSVIINILLNAILIFGLLGINAMEYKGAAIATVIARIVEFVLAISVYIFSKCPRLSFKHLFRFDKDIEKHFSKIAKTLIFNEFIWGAGVTIYSIVIGHLGVHATAANSIASVVKDLVTSLARGIGVGGGILIGYKLGRSALEETKKDGDRLVKFSILSGIGCALIILISTPIVLSTIKLSSISHNYLKLMLIICSVYMIAKSLNIAVINGIFYAGGDTKFDAYSLGVTMWGIIIPLALLGTFVFSWPVLVIYLIISLDEIIKIPWVISHYKKYRWLNNLTK